jgi:WD40 repeat protein
VSTSEDSPSETTSAGISIGGNARVDSVNVHGNVIGRDYVVVTEDQSFDVSDVPDNPYRGLASFTYTERAFYGGRAAQIQDALRLLTTPGDERSVLFITGASGSGKSSFAQAGLVPALEALYSARNLTVNHAVMRPGRVPSAALAQALDDLGLESLAKTSASVVNVLVIDQFEEVFTQSESSEREAICAQLANAPPFTDARTHVLLTLRSDYLGALFGVPALYELSKRSSIELRAMTPTELAEAIRAPLDELNRHRDRPKRWDPALVQKLCDDVGTNATLLPLLQVTLTSLWQDPPRKLVLGRYRNLTTALQSTADRVYEQDARGRDRPPAERDEIMSIFLDLVEVSMDDDPRRDVRRTMPRLTLVRDKPERGPLIDELVDKRLLSSSGGPSDEARIDIIHETLLTNWTELRNAIAQQRERLQSRERFVDAKREWLDHHRSDDYRLQGAYLLEARALVTAGDIVTHDADARAFIEHSAAVENDERQRELDQARALAAEQQARANDSARAARRLRVWLVAVVVAALAAIGAAAVAVVLYFAATRQASINASRELAAESQTQLAVDPELSILLARAAEARTPTQQADEALREALIGSPIRRVLNGPGAALNGVALSVDGSRVAASGLDGSVRVWDPRTGAVIVDVRAHQRALSALALTPDGSALLTASTSDPQVRLWDPSTGNPLAQLATDGPGVAAAVFSPSGRLIGAATTDGKARVWNARSREVVVELGQLSPMALTAGTFGADDERIAVAGLDGVVRVRSLPSGETIALSGHSGPISALAFNVAGDALLTASFDGTARVWATSNSAGRLLLKGGGAPLSAAAFSPTGRTVVAGDSDGHAWLWSVGDGRQLAELRGHSRRISSVAFSPSGAQVLTTSDDGTARVWDAVTGAELLPLRGHTLQISAAQFSNDGLNVVTSSWDKSVRIWSLAATPIWNTLSGHTAEVLGVAFSPDGTRLASAGQDNSVRVWRAGAGEQARRDLSSAASSTAFSPDGSRLAFGLWDGTAYITRAPQLDNDVALRGHTDWIYSVAFSPDGARLLTASKDRTARLWDVGTGAQLGSLSGHSADVTGAAWSLDGRRIVTASADATARVWNADTFQPVLTLSGHMDIVRRAIFSPDGRYIVTGSLDGTARVWDASSGAAVTTLRRHTAGVIGIALSPDGSLLATASADRTVLIWDTGTSQTVAELRGATDQVNDVAFSPDGQRLAAASGDGVIRIYSREQFAPMAEVLSLSLTRVTRQPPALTTEERARFVHD